MLTSLNSPPLVAAAGLATLVGLPFAQGACASAGVSSLALLKGANVAAFAANCVAVSVPGRIDGRQDDAMRRQGELDPSKPSATGQGGGSGGTSSSSSPSESAPLAEGSGRRTTQEYDATYGPARGRTLVSPSGWAFAIWGPIYIGEAAVIAAQFIPGNGLEQVLPQMTAPFVAANIFQSLWCASFRSSYGTEGWTPYVSSAMLAGTAYSLSKVHAVGCSAAAAGLGWYFLPLALHFGWTTAATLVNLNGSVAMNPSNSDRAVAAVGHASAVAAAALGVGVTLVQSAPTYGFTVAWALAACADGMKKRVASSAEVVEGEGGGNRRTAAIVQKNLCWLGSAVCAATAVVMILAGK